jgi:hypothetical protein
MNYEVTLTMRLVSDNNEDRVARLFEALFEFGTIKESIAEGLHLLEDPRMVTIAVAGVGTSGTEFSSDTASY